MREDIGKGAERSLAGEALSATDAIGRAYGCAFCITGKEQAVAQYVEQVCDDAHAIVARKAVLKTVQDEAITVDKILYPGYVFFEAPAHGEHRIPQNANIISILASSGTGDWRLYGEDAKLVKWLFSYDGLLPFSQAIKEGDFVRILSGPLKDTETNIICFDKHRERALVAVTFCNRLVKTWLKYEILEKM